MNKSPILIIIGLLLCSIQLISQTKEIEKLENELKSAKSSIFISKSFQLSKLLLENKKYDEAIIRMDRAIKEARRSNNSAQIATVNKEKAKLILNYCPSNLKYLNIAFNAVETSLGRKVQAIEVENLGLLKKISARTSDKKLKDKVNKLTGNIELKIEEKKKEEAFKEFKKRDEEEKFEDFKKLETERVKLETAVDKLADQTTTLNRLNRNRERQINRMSEQAAKRDLIMANNRIVMDSMKNVAYRDSVAKAEKQQKIERQELELEKQTAEIALTNTRNRFFLALAAIIGLISLGIFLRLRATRKHNKELELKNSIIDKEREISNNLLLNILPESIAEELKEHNKVKTQFYNKATVMFLDFMNFSSISKALSPERLIADLHTCFSAFDEIVEEAGVEKIKTIGDAYLVAAGVPTITPDHAKRIVKAAIKMQAYLSVWNAERRKDGLPEFNARIGIHSGPLIAGIVGNTKFAFDIWGDTVNIAARMESNSEKGRINISSSTKELLQDTYEVEFRGKLHAKNMGEMECYFIKDKH